jgi:glycosyltransferase involved in cell wall biosynthesis
MSNIASHQKVELPSDYPNLKKWPWENNIPKRSGNMQDGRAWPKISIVTPSYNQGQFLEETIRSVLLQGYPNFEYIIMDGGSTDNSVGIIKKYEHWITHWESQKDGGQSEAINKGFQRATGDIIAWLNSDDVYAPNALPIVAEALCDKKRAMLVGEAIITKNSEALDGEHDRRRPDFASMLYEGRTFCQPSVFWTMDLWRKVKNIDEQLYYVLDYDLWLRMRPFAYEEIFIDEILAYARTQQNQKYAELSQLQQRIRYQNEKVYACLKSAILLGQPPLFWLFKALMRRWKIALKRKRPDMLFGSQLSKHAFKRIMSRKALKLK